MEALLKNWGGEKLLIQYDEATGSWILIAMHSSRLGPATGGTRMKPYSDLQSAIADACNLSAGMTYKFAVPGFPRGGGKAVLSIPQGLTSSDRQGLLLRYGELIKDLNGMFYTGPDVGTSVADMDTIAKTGAPYIFCRSEQTGGAGSPGPYTALGVYTAIQVTCQSLFGSSDLAGRLILVQGVGSVGSNLIDKLLAENAQVLFSDVEEEIIKHFRDERGITYVTPDEVYATDCDIFSPCALGGILNDDTIPMLNCKAVAGGANNQLANPKDAERLRSHHILYAPDYVVNIGGAMGVIGIETMGWSPQEAEQQVVASVRGALDRIFKISNQEGITTEVAALRLANENLSE
jgi:leucine dehydrogenase